MKDYSQGKIYKLYSVSNEDLVYYGSTATTLNKRLTKHISEYKNDNIRACKSKLVIAACDYKIELIENYPCNSKAELERREGEYIRTNKCLNKVIPGRTNKEAIAERKKKWYNQFNKEKVTCECGCVVTKSSLIRHKKTNKHLELIKD